jgi:hypothetical protein
LLMLDHQRFLVSPPLSRKVVATNSPYRRICRWCRAGALNTVATTRTTIMRGAGCLRPLSWLRLLALGSPVVVALVGEVVAGVAVVAVLPALVRVVAVVRLMVLGVLAALARLVRLGVMPVVVVAVLLRWRPLCPCLALRVSVGAEVWCSRRLRLPLLRRCLVPLLPRSKDSPPLLAWAVVAVRKPGLAVVELSVWLRCGAGRLPDR